MLYDVKEIAKKSQLSEATIYRKLGLREMQMYIVKKAGKKYLDDLGLQALQQIITANINDNDNDDKNNKNEKNKDIEQSVNPEIAVSIDDLLSAKNELINNLKSQLEQTEGQLKLITGELTIKNTQIANRDRQLENMQVLLKDQKSPQLIESTEERDIRLVNRLLDTIEQRKNEVQAINVEEKKGFFSFFKRKV